MTIGRKLLWFVIGLAAATALAAAATRPASAQSLPSILPPARPPQVIPARSLPKPANDRAGESFTGMPPRSAADPDTLRGTDDDDAGAASIAAEDVRPRPQLPPGLRAAARDGDLSYPPEPAQPRDGVIDIGEPQPTPDGIDMQNVDARPAEEAAHFDLMPQPPDTQLFQIEDVVPLEDRRIQRLSRFEPYDAIGIRIGSFVLFPETEVGGVAYSNKLRSIAPRSDVAFEARPSARFVSDWKTHAVELRASSGLSFHNAFPGEDERNYTIEARGRLDIMRRTNLQGLYSHQASQESRSGIDANRLGPRADIATDQFIAALSHRFNRLSLQLRGGVTETTFGEVRSPTGIVTTNRERNLIQTDETVRLTWELKPTLQVFGETGLVQRTYPAAPVGDGILRNSHGERVRLGLGFGETGAYLRGEASIGIGLQHPDDERLQNVDTVLFDANVAWRVTPMTSLLLTARSDIVDTTTPQASGVVSRAAGIEARHAFRRYLIATAGLNLTRSDYQGVALDESELAARLSLEYYVNREITLYSRYQHLWFASSEPDRDYEADELRVGVRIRR